MHPSKQSSIEEAINKLQPGIERRVSENESCCVSSSNRFTIKAILAWLIICVPGNIFALKCIYVNSSNDSFSSDTSYGNSSSEQVSDSYVNMSQHLGEGWKKNTTEKMNFESEGVSKFNIFSCLIIAVILRHNLCIFKRVFSYF